MEATFHSVHINIKTFTNTLYSLLLHKLHIKFTTERIEKKHISFIATEILQKRDDIFTDGKRRNVYQSQGVKNYAKGCDNKVMNNSVGATGIISLYLCLPWV